ncbi:hypothetical protein [Bifidobacterium moukalabense]|uniref:Uncharacterized protein n=1 Tax=Bifidobacterium moukalabense DSM 27321 TaxID=1435051 RepID=W4NAW7_9BIFI|nr:hypothetical protein [Bifidobacterium moukalabense]ETY72217.1 hypothetical protein BMOU_0231 [Bifidobacterium moukalabense DSM 27321]
MANGKHPIDITPQEPAIEIDDDAAAVGATPPETPEPAGEDIPEEFPPAGHRWETFETARPDGVRVSVTRDIDTGVQRVHPVEG